MCAIKIRGHEVRWAGKQTFHVDNVTFYLCSLMYSYLIAEEKQFIATGLVGLVVLSKQTSRFTPGPDILLFNPKPELIKVPAAQ